MSETELIWLLPVIILVFIFVVSTTADLHTARQQQLRELQELDPVWFPHPNPRPPLPPSRISSATGLVNMVVVVEDDNPI